MVTNPLSSKYALMDYLLMRDAEAEFLQRLAFRRYAAFSIPKRNGAIRFIYAPDSRLAWIQRQLLKLLEEIYEPRYAAHGFIKERSVLTAAKRHIRMRHILTIDLEDFFTNIRATRINNILREFIPDDETRNFFVALVTYKGRLPQGAPTSPILSNIAAFGLDNTLTRFAKESGFRYTRYGDDITFSSRYKLRSLVEQPFVELPAGKVPYEFLSPRLRFEIEHKGFSINPEKSWIMGAGGRKQVCGLTVNEKVNVSRKYIRNARAKLHSIRKFGYRRANLYFKVQVGNERKELVSSLQSQISWIGQVRGKSDYVYRSLAEQFNKVFGPILKIEPTADELLDSCVWVIEHQESSSQGSVFHLNDAGWITAEHVISDYKIGDRLEVFNPISLSKRYKATVIKSEPHTDLAIIDVEIPDERFNSLTASSAFFRNDATQACGYPDFTPGQSLVKRTGYIEQIFPANGVNRIELSSEISSGMSGGPVLNEDGKVIGIIHKGNNAAKKNKLSSKNLATSIMELRHVGVNISTF